MDKKKLGIAALVSAIVSGAFFFISPNSYGAAIAVYLVGAILGLVAVVLGLISVKEGKAMSVIGIVIGALMALILLLAVLGCFTMKSSKDCVEKNEEVYVCNFNGTELEVPSNLVTEDQKKKD